MEPLGFVNTGNDCYFNSVIQLLVNIPEYITYLNIRKENNLHLSTLEKIIYIVNKKRNYDKSIKIFDMLHHIDPKEYDGTQKDACEFMLRLLENYVDNNPKSLSEQIYCRTCLKCGNQINSKNVQFPIYVEKYNMDKFVIPQPGFFIDHSNCEIEMKCDKCSHSIHSEKHGYKVDDILFLCIKRFNYDLTKDNSPIENLLEFSQGKILLGVVCHYGTTTSGHYFTINFINEKWYLLNDEKVEEITTENVIRYAENFGYLFVFSV